jgi:hypothetical protein
MCVLCICTLSVLFMQIEISLRYLKCLCFFPVFIILSHVTLTKDGVRIRNWVY